MPNFKRGADTEQGFMADGSVKGYTAATLPDPASLLTGTQYGILDYGGNIATAVNGQWRFEFPFRTTWAGRPAVNLVPVGTELQVTDYANQKWVSDGTYWRPAQGRVTIRAQWGSYLTPLATLQNTASGIFTIPNGNPKISAGMIIPGTTIRTKPVVKKTGTGGTVVFAAQIGTTESASDAVLAVTTSFASNGVDIALAGSAHFSSVSNRMSSIKGIGDGQTHGSVVGAGTDGTNGINIASDMFIIYRCYNGNAADKYDLIGYEISLEV